MLAGTGIFYGCRQDESSPVKPAETLAGQNSELTADIAGDYFRTVWPDRAFGLGDDPQTRSDGGTIVLTPDLTDGREMRQGTIEVVEYPVYGARPLIIVDRETKDAMEAGASFRIMPVMRLVVRKDLEAGAYGHFYMEISGSRKYLESGEPAGENNYFYRSPSFDGTVMYYDLEQGLVHGWLYADGRITHRLVPAGDESFPGLTTRFLDDGSEGEFYYEWVCENGMEYDPTLGIEVPFVECWKEVRFRLTDKLPDDSGGGTGGYTPPPPTSGSPGGSPPLVSQIAPKADKLLTSDSLTVMQWQQVERMIEKIMQDCMGGRLYNGLLEKLNGGALGIKFSSSGEGGNISASTGVITLRTAESNVLLHELFHAYQFLSPRASTNPDAAMNREIEAWYAQYKYVSKLPEYQPGTEWHDRYLWGAGKSIAQMQYILDSKGNLKEGYNDIQLGTMVITAAQKFREIPEYSSYNFDYEMYGSENLESFQELSKGC